jgi:hypothetical protein
MGTSIRNKNNITNKNSLIMPLITAILLLATISGCTDTSSNTIILDITVKEARNSEYGDLYFINETKIISGIDNSDFGKEGVLIIAGAAYDIWHSKPSEEWARVTLDPQPMTEDEVDFFQDGTGAVISHFLATKNGEETYYYNILQTQWVDQAELNEARSESIADFDGITLVKTAKLMMEVDETSRNPFQGEILEYPAALGTIEQEDINAPYRSVEGHYIFGYLPYGINDKFQWKFIYIEQESYFIFHIPERNDPSVYVFHDGVVTEMFEMKDEDNYYTYFSESFEVQSPNGTTEISAYLYHFLPDGYFTKEYYSLTDNVVATIKDNGHKMKECHSSIEMSREIDGSVKENTFALYGNDVCDPTMTAGIYIDGVQVADSFIVDENNRDFYFSSGIFSPNFNNLASEYEFDDGEYVIVWNIEESDGEIFTVEYLGEEDNRKNFSLLNWREDEQGNYHIITETEDYKLVPIVVGTLKT